MAELRLRIDSWWGAGRKRAVLLGAAPDPRDHPEKRWSKGWLRELSDPAFEAAQIGDVWIARGHDMTRSTGESDPTWPIVGYGLTCPLTACEYGVHVWDHAYDCKWPREPCKMGADRTSCWTWTGSIEGGDLTAQPSLHCMKEKGGCGYHGFLTGGVMSLSP